MSTESEFIILCGPDTSVTEIPIVIVAGQSQDNNHTTVETFILLPRSCESLVTWSSNYHGTSLYVPSNESPARHLSNSEIALAEGWLRSYLFRELSPNQRILNPELYSYKLERLDQDFRTRFFIHEDYKN